MSGGCIYMAKELNHRTETYIIILHQRSFHQTNNYISHQVSCNRRHILILLASPFSLFYVIILFSTLSILKCYSEIISSFKDGSYRKTEAKRPAIPLPPFACVQGSKEWHTEENKAGPGAFLPVWLMGFPEQFPVS